MAEARLTTVCGIVGSEWRTYRRSPVCLIGAIAAVAVLLSESRTPAGWPPAGVALDGFQLATSFLVGIMVFLLAAGSLAHDLDPGRSQLVFSRPIPIGVYLVGKLAAAISFGWVLVGLLVLIGLCRPLFHGIWTPYPAGPFLTVAAVCGLPLVVYAGSLGMFFTAVSNGRIIIALPAFLLYFFCVAVLRMGGGDINLLDFSMRLYGQVIWLDVPVRLTDTTFSHLLDPVQSKLILRGLLYLVLSGLFAIGAGWIIARQRGAAWQRRVGPRVRTHRPPPGDGDHDTHAFPPH